MDIQKKRDQRKKEIKEKVAHLEQAIKDLEKELQTVDCDHEWTGHIYDPIRRPGYRDPGDPPGTMGVDRRLPSYIPPLEIPRWTRRCLKCGKVQETKDVTMETRTLKKPRFPDF